MKIAIFDCFSGASGNMIIGTLYGITLDKKDMDEIVSSLGLNLDFEVREVYKNGIRANLVEVNAEEIERTFKEVSNLIENSSLDEEEKKESLRIFESLAKAEGRIHGRDYRNAVFHEVGSDDAIFDVVCAVRGILRLKSKGYRIFTTPVYAGSGFIRSHHGKLPVPAPATLEILKNSNLNVVFDGDGELLTPTGAVILSHFSEGEFKMPLKVEEVSYGAGTRKTEKPNLLRLILGYAHERDSIAIVETNIDDMSGEDLANAVEILSRMCHDVCIIPATGKKSRPSWILKAITDFEKSEIVAETIMRETTSIGVRIIPVHHRVKARRKIDNIRVTINGKDFSVRVKYSDYTAKPEFEDLKKISEETNVPLKNLRKIVEEKINEAKHR